MDRVRKGDTVVVIAGKEKGKRGKVLRIIEKRTRGGRARDDGQAPHQAVAEDQQGGIIEKEGSIHLSNVMLIDPGTTRPLA